jgi:hypothetical protein
MASVVILIILSLITVGFNGAGNISEIPEAQKISINEISDVDDYSSILAKTPKVFTENRGQLDNDAVRFYDIGGSVWFTDDGVWIRLKEGSAENQFKSVVVKQEFVGANPVRPEGRQQASWYSNFFYGNDQSKWQSYVHNYREVYYENLYKGIDLRYYITDNGLKYDFIVQPGADVEQIKLRYDGAERILKSEHSNLIIKTVLGDFTDKALYIYQDYDGARHKIEGRLIIFNDLDYGFEITENYRNDLPLVIDPELEFSTFAGGTEREYPNDIAVDTSGNSYVTGYTHSNDFPNSTGANDTTFNGDRDTFIFKLNPTGTMMVYSTYLGGVNEDYGFGIEVNSGGDAFITGNTISTNFPVTSNAYDKTHNGTSDAFLTRLNSAGSLLVYSTFIGGINNDWGKGIDIDSSDNAYITGYTFSVDFPVSADAFDKTRNSDDAYVLKLNPTGTDVIYSTYVGGSDDEQAEDIVVDSSGSPYITGWTQSNDFPATDDAYDNTLGDTADVFVCMLNSNFSNVTYATYVGGDDGSFLEWGYGIDIDSAGNVYVTGQADYKFPTTPGVIDPTPNSLLDGFALKLNFNMSKLIYSTYIGGTDDDICAEISVDANGYAVITGFTRSIDFLTTGDAMNGSLLGVIDGFVTVLNENGSQLIYSSYIGGSAFDDGRGLTLDENDNIYLTGFTYSPNYYTTPGAMNTSINGMNDIYIMKLGFSDIVDIDFFAIQLNNTNVTRMYSMYKPYAFHVIAQDSSYYPDSEQIRLILDPSGENIQVEWDKVSGTFYELSDPNDYIKIDQSNSSSSTVANFDQ